MKRVDVHALWVSKVVLDLIGTLPEAVEGGVIIRDGEGQATGVFVDNAMKVISVFIFLSYNTCTCQTKCCSPHHDFLPASIIPPWTEAQRASYLTTAISKMHSHGITSVHDAMLSVADVAFLKALDEKKELDIRIYGMGACDPLNTACRVVKYEGDRFTIR